MPKRYSVVKPVTLPRNMLTSLERDCALSCPSCSPKFLHCASNWTAYVPCDTTKFTRF